MRRRWSWDFGLGREVGYTFWAMAFLEAGFGAYLGIWPLWIERLGAPIQVVGIVLGSSGILRLAVIIPSAALAERFGAYRLIVGARVIAGVGFLVAAAAGHWTHLAGTVVALAIGELAFPLIWSHVTTHAHGNRIRALSLVFTVGPSVALAISPLLSGLLIAQWGIRAAFGLAAACTVASLFFFARLKPDAAIARSATQVRSSYRGALGDATVRRLLVLQGATIFSLALGTSFIPTFLEDVRGLSPSRIASFGAAAAVGSAIFGIAVARIGRLQRAPFIGAAIAVVAMIVGFTLFVQTGAPALILIAFICRGGLFSAWALFASALGVTATAQDRARAFAMSEMIGGLTFSLAPMAAGPLYAIRPSLPLTGAIVLGVALIPFLIRAQRVANAQAISSADQADDPPATHEETDTEHEAPLVASPSAQST